MIICPKGLWHETTTLTLTFGISPGGDSFLGNKAGGMQLPVTTIDELVNELRLDRVDFIKMDIEGAERDVLSEVATTLSAACGRGSQSRRITSRSSAAVLRAESLKAYDGYKLLLHSRPFA